eukprot:241211_1
MEQALSNLDELLISFDTFDDDSITTEKSEGCGTDIDNMDEILGVKISNNPRERDCEYVLGHWIRIDLNSKLNIPNAICSLIHSYFYCGDEWCAFSKYLCIVNRSNNAKIEDIGSNEYNIFGDMKARGSAYGLQIIEPPSNSNTISKYYWKLKMSAEYDYTYAIGFIREEDGILNQWYIEKQYSVGIYSDTQIWTQSNLLCNDGIGFKENDLINLCLDYDIGCVYAQRCEYIEYIDHGYQKMSDDENGYNGCEQDVIDIITDVEIHKNYIVHKAQRVFNGIDVDAKYRLACYLRTKYQNVEIIKFSQQPFKEWNIDIVENDKIKKVDKPVIVMYQ